MAQAIRIELVSDTATKPTAAMRKAMAEADVGDEQLGEDPSVNRLNERVADMLGKEAALFLPSGTMCNAIAIAVHCRAGDEILAAEGAHIIAFEGAGAAALAGALIRPIPAPRGIFSAFAMRAAIRPVRAKTPRARMVAVEQTSNFGGGAVWPLDAVQSVCDAARQAGLARHMDGARLFNAAIASGKSVGAFAAPFDSVWIDLSKGLGCPVGAVLAGSKAFIAEAWRWKYRLGGAMRQAGVLAAAGLHALDHHVDRLAEDHDNARLLAERIAGLPGVLLDPAEVETNLVFFEMADGPDAARDLLRALAERGIRIGLAGGARLRAVTHLGVTREEVLEAADAMADILTPATA